MSLHLPLLSNRSLLSLTLPGSHSSASYALSATLGPPDTGSALLDAAIDLAALLRLPLSSVVLPWALAQTGTLYEQAMAGCRYFDVRAAWTGIEWRVHHMLLGDTVDAAVADVARFVAEHREEVLVVEVSHVLPVEGVTVTADAMAQLIAVFLARLSPFLYSPSPQHPTFASLTVGDMVRSNQRVVLSLALPNATHGAAPPPLPPSILPASALYNTYADTAELPAMLRFNNATLIAYNLERPFLLASAPLFKLSYTLTPDASTVLESLKPGRVTSLQGLAGEAGAALPSVMTGWRMARLQCGNVVLMDFFQSDLVDLLLMQLDGSRGGSVAAARR